MKRQAKILFSINQYFPSSSLILCASQLIVAIVYYMNNISLVMFGNIIYMYASCLVEKDQFVLTSNSLNEA